MHKIINPEINMNAQLKIKKLKFVDVMITVITVK